jgi:hypothetical protein
MRVKIFVGRVCTISGIICTVILLLLLLRALCASARKTLHRWALQTGQAGFAQRRGGAEELRLVE